MILCWPLAIVAVLAATRAARAHGAGDTATAHREARTARARARLGVLLGSVGTTLALTLDIFLVVAGVQHGPGLLARAGIETAATYQAVPAPYRSAAAPEREAIAVDSLQLRTGDCFMAPDWDSAWESIDVIPCSRMHDAEVIAVAEHPQQGGYPGSSAISQRTWDECASRYDAYSGTTGSDYGPLWTFEPTPANWAAGWRASVCFVDAPFAVRGDLSDHPQVFESRGDL